MKCEKINSLNRDLVNTFIKQHWYTTTMIIRGKEIDMTKVDGFYFRDGQTIIGLITYIVYNNILEITSLDSLRENQGIGSELVETVIHEAKERKLQKIVLITTNDNINAIRFYQKRGFDMAHLFRNALDISRKIKPEIPLIGENSIPLRHEIEFELFI
ncbi:MAG: GNAT family N-acetyltransferase [Lachnospiraceae bacterium]|nr:GNAT family N-acetyltransferase [Lachnospiraceae bacterium]MBD5522826.1 GNAT family N-acetyltransferase [Lachnospiraceae bacterium]